ncbi:MAG: WD40 repeat domain-containing protein [Proteobacteria bacterium]|nr:WD40 repeat domain-containing protein [Pseudomonadota bacterium]
MFSDSLHDIDHSRWFKFSRKLFCLSFFLLGFLISVMILGTPEIAIAQDQETTANEESKDKINYLLTQTLRLGENRVREAFFSADSMQIVALGNNHNLEIFNSQTGKRQRVIPTQEHQALTLSLHPGGRMAVTGGMDDTVRLWDTGSTLAQGVLRGHLDDVTSLSMDTSGDFLLSGSLDGTLILWNMKTQELVTTREEAHLGEISSLVFQPSGTLAVSAGEDGKVKLWSLPELEPIHTFSKHRKRVTQIKFTIRGDKLLTASLDGTLGIWDWGKKRQLNEVIVKQPIIGFDLPPEGMEGVIATQRGAIRIWDFEEGIPLRDVDTHAGEVERVHFDLSGRRVIAALADGHVQVWELGSSLYLKSLKGHQRSIESLDFANEGVYLISSSSDKSVRIWDVERGLQVRSYDLENHRVQSVRFSPDAESFATAGADSSARVWETESGQRLKNLTQHKGKVNSVDFHPKENVLLSGGSDRQWMLWDLNTETVILKNLAHEDQIQQVRFSENGKMFATAGSDRVVHLWSYPEGERLLSLKGHRKAIVAIAFNPKIPMLATASQDMSILLWDLSEPLSLRQPKRIIHGENRALLSVSLNSDDSLIAVSSLGPEIKILSYPDDLPELESAELPESKSENEPVEPGVVSTAVSNASYETDTSVDEGDLTEAEKKPLTREQLQVYMTEPVKTESNRHQGLQEKLNQMLKQSSPCDDMDRMQQLALMVLDLKPGDLAAYHALIKTGALKGDFNLVYLAAQASAKAKLETRVYDYQKENDVVAFMTSWREEVFNPVHHRGKSKARLRIKDCEGNENTLNIPDAALHVRLPEELLESLARIPKIIEFRDFSGISDEEYRNRIFHETERVLSGATPYTSSRLPLQQTDQVPPLETGIMVLDLKAAKVWKDRGRSEFQLRHGEKNWQTFISDEDGMAVMRLPQGKYYLKVGAYLEKTFFLEKDAEMKLSIR